MTVIRKTNLADVKGKKNEARQQNVNQFTLEA